MQKQLWLCVILALVAVATCSGGWCKDRKQNSRHWRHGGFPDRRGCCPTHKGNVTTLTYIEDFYNSTLIACAYPDGSAFGTYGADAVPPVKGQVRGYYTSAIVLGVDNYFEQYTDGTSDEGIHWFNILPDSSVVGSYSSDSAPTQSAEWDWHIVSIETTTPARCIRKPCSRKSKKY